MPLFIVELRKILHCVERLFASSLKQETYSVWYCLIAQKEYKTSAGLDISTTTDTFMFHSDPYKYYY